MKKLFNNSTKADEIETAPQTKTKRKFFKTFGFASLAVLMGTAGIFAFAPLGANSPSLASANESEMTTEQVLITPKADDPVIYTTESGLKIKFGNDLPSTYNNQLSSGSLTGFPYFTTSNGTNTYTWVIIGQSSDISESIMFRKSIAEPLSSLKSPSPSGQWSECFFNTQYEASSPAGTVINNEIMTDYMVDSLRVSSEIPTGCVLVLANTNVATGVYNTSSNQYYYYSGSSYYYYRYTYHTTYIGTIKTVMDGYYTNASFGLTDIKSNIVPITLITNGMVGSGAGGYTATVQTVENAYIYPLGGIATSTFYVSHYLTAREATLTSAWWLRGSNSGNSTTSWNEPRAYHYGAAYSVNTTGISGAHYYCNNSGVGYRPAFCLNIS